MNIRPNFLQSPNNKFGSIIFPPGFAGNHLRWLLFLDPQFNSVGICENNISAKFKFVQEKIYPSHRSWYNWLEVEWRFRTTLDRVIEVCHGNFNWEQSSNKELYLTTADRDLPFYHYYHFNLGLNGHTPAYFKTQIQQWMEEFELLQTRIHEFPNKKICLCDPLFDPVLNRDFYQSIVDFYGFSDNYDIAQQVHSLYSQCKKTSTQEFCDYFVGDEFSKHIDFLRAQSNNNPTASRVG